MHGFLLGNSKYGLTYRITKFLFKFRIGDSFSPKPNNSVIISFRLSENFLFTPFPGNFFTDSS